MEANFAPGSIPYLIVLFVVWYEMHSHVVSRDYCIGSVAGAKPANRRGEVRSHVMEVREGE